MHGDLVPIGKLTRAHGLKGLLKALPYREDPEIFLRLRTVFLRTQEGGLSELEFTSVKRDRRWFLVKVAGVDGRDQAEPLAGCEILVRRSDLETTPGEILSADLIGLRVQTENGTALGEIEQIIETGANDVLVVRRGSDEHLIPRIEQVVLSVDIEAGLVVIRPMPGLLEDEDEH